MPSGFAVALRFEGVPVDVVGRLGELRRLVRPIQPRVDLRQLIVDFVDALAVGLHRLLRGGELAVCNPVSFALSMRSAASARAAARVTSSSSCVNCRCVFFHSRSKSSHTIQIVDRNRKMLDAANTTFRKSML